MNRIYPILSIEAARAYEAGVLEGDPCRTAMAMANAGEAIGKGILQDYAEIRQWPEAPEFLVLAGKGLNAGDAFIACSYLRVRLTGMRVSLVLAEGEDQLNSITADALAGLKATMGEDLQIFSIDEYLQLETASVDVVLDGLYGHGFRPPLSKAVAELLCHVNGRTDIYLRAAIDLPSGLGEGLDENCFVADTTYVPGVGKQPCFLRENGAHVGRIRFLEISPFLDQPVSENHLEFVASPRAYQTLNQLRPAHSDKRDYGHCMILAGSNQLPGASLMSAMGSLQAGAGLVTIFSPSTAAIQLAGTLPEAMWRPLPVTMEGGLDVETVRIVTRFASKGSCLLIGPGLVLDRSTVFVLCRIIREVHLPLVLDASALTQDVLAAVLGRPLNAGPVILTPHAGEFARMNGVKEMAITTETLVQFSQKYRAVVVLKGSPTCISDGKRHYTAPVGGPVLARGGTGDILAGMTATLLAQNPDDPLAAAVQAVTWHGAAADSLSSEHGSIAVKTTELLPHLSAVLRA